METSVVFNPSDYDSWSGLPHLHLSTLIHILLPIRLVKWSAVKKNYEGLICQVNSLLTEDLKDNFKCVVTGSRAEGYTIPVYVPTALPKQEELFFGDLSDVDVLLINEKVPVSTKKLQDNHDTNCKAYLDYDNVYPGYARICIPNIKQDDDSFVFDGDAGKHYLSSTRYMKKLVSGLSKCDKEETTEVVIQGPAITLDNNIKLTAANMNTPDGTTATDLVYALPCLPWPEIANSVKDRTLKSEWLQCSLVDSIINDGCHIVAVPSKSSTNPELEWRLSFSASEGRIAREAVTDNQRQCYLFLKILRYQNMKLKSILSSYVFKSVFLHCCEQLPVHYWKDFPGNCVLYMLDILLECLQKKHVPTYFLPENNLIGHLTNDEIAKAISTAEKLRLDPIAPVLGFMEDKVFACHCIKLKFRTIVKPLLDDIKEFRQHKNKVKCIKNGIFNTYYLICISLLKEQSDDKEGEMQKHQEAAKFMKDIYTNLIQPLNAYDSLVHFLNSFGLGIKEVELSMKFFEAVVSLSDENPEYLWCRGNLACMYHSAAYEHAFGSVLRKEYLDKAGEMFKQVYNEDRSSSIDYVTFLVKQDQFDEAMRILEDIIDKENIINTDYFYNSKECETLEDPLKTHVQKHGIIQGDTLSFAYFYMVKCLLVIEKDSRHSSLITATLNKFSTYCEDKKNEALFVLLQYANEIAAQISTGKSFK
ncbi:uncharacterized protein LOC123556850 [Mercenaria mercenaria]|uniref:uncharacterized protein LOC123556850 n=1 Tax=Mercenaria mercenaria TaxID=6596 RepID=UPI00234EB1BE|nr:uncharacterized protein LOC123556850 [Mercenaria mercenaria]